MLSTTNTDPVAVALPDHWQRPHGHRQRHRLNIDCYRRWNCQLLQHHHFMPHLRSCRRRVAENAAYDQSGLTSQVEAMPRTVMQPWKRFGQTQIQDGGVGEKIGNIDLTSSQTAITTTIPYMRTDNL